MVPKDLRSWRWHLCQGPFFFFFLSSKMYFQSLPGRTSLFFHITRCITLANLELKHSLSDRKPRTHKKQHVCCQYTMSTHTLSHLTWWLRVHHRWRRCHCVVIGGGWRSKRIRSWCSCLFCKWLKVSTQDNKSLWSFWTKKVSICKRILNESLVPTYDLFASLRHLAHSSLFFPGSFCSSSET